jgi:hypothetical protein
VEKSALFLDERHLVLCSEIRHRGNSHRLRPGKGCVMFDELTEEMLDLSASVRGYGAATYAVVDDEPGCCGGCGTIVLCCTCTTLCW